MIRDRRMARFGRYAAVVAVLALAAACRQPGGDPAPNGTGLNPAPTPPIGHSRIGTNLHLLSRPAKKYFGVSVNGAPASMQGLAKVTMQVNRTPNLVGYFSDWTHAFQIASARNACDAGIVPMLTWDSWSWEDLENGVPAVTQPSYALRRIAAGAFDGYIRRFAESVKALGCPIMLRLDHEANGHWYPWGLATSGMHNTAAQYVAMWRHVWRIFQSVGVHNVIWVWSPNVVYARGVDQLAGLYPGNKYVDVVGMDGYLLLPGDTVSRVYTRTFRQMRHIAPGKPWLLAETGVASGPHQATQITGLLHAVATNKRLIGLVYFDEPAARANWSFSSSPGSLAAFRRGISVPSYGQAPSGGS